MTETERLLAATADKKRQSEEQYMLTFTRFLSLGERSAVAPLCKGNDLAVFWGGYPEGVTYAILLMNVLTPLIDRWTMPKPFGKVKN